MNNILALIITIPNLILIYLITYFTQNLSGKRQFYGVSLNSDYFTKDEFSTLDKKYKKSLTIGFIFTLIISLALIFIFNFYELASLISILGFITYQFIVYVSVHNKVKALKYKLLETNPNVDIKRTKLLLDTDFLNDKNRIVKRYSLLLTIPMIVTSLVSIYTMSRYSSLPDMIPVHWGFNGVADDFIEKSFIKFLGYVLMMVVCSVIVYISSLSSLKTRAKLDVDDVKASKKAHIYYLHKYGMTFLVLNISTQVLFITTLIAMSNASDISPYILYTCLALTIIPAIYLTYIYYKSPNRVKVASYSVDDDDSYWILGALYNNPNDPSLFVNKRFGVGWTVNIGNTKGKIYIGLTILILVGALLLALTQ